jgi:hypothetical protein
MALDASATVPISTKAKLRIKFVARSTGRVTDLTLPAWLNS